MYLLYMFCFAHSGNFHNDTNDNCIISIGFEVVFNVFLFGYVCFLHCQLKYYLYIDHYLVKDETFCGLL